MNNFLRVVPTRTIFNRSFSGDKEEGKKQSVACLVFLALEESGYMFSYSHRGG